MIFVSLHYFVGNLAGFWFNSDEKEIASSLEISF